MPFFDVAVADLATTAFSDVALSAAADYGAGAIAGDVAGGALAGGLADAGAGAAYGSLADVGYGALDEGIVGQGAGDLGGTLGNYAPVSDAIPTGYGASSNILSNLGTSGIGNALQGAAGLYSGIKGGQLQSQAAQNATQLQQQIYGQQRQDLAPYAQTGQIANQALAGQMFNPDGSINTQSQLNKPFTAADYQQSPGYQFQLSQGIDAAQNLASRSGVTGNTLKALDTFGQGLANTDYQQAYQNYINQQNTLASRLGGLSQSGQNAATQTGNFAQNFGNQAGQNITGGASAQSAGLIGGLGAASNAFNSYNQNQNQQQLNQLLAQNYGY